jgi:prepilin-type N-terminal cleavage/methylation domain-containing protein
MVLPRPEKTSGTKGFSLIEILAVMAILSIMLFITLPRFGMDKKTDDIQGVARWLTISVARLKAKAAGEQKAYILVADMVKNTFFIENPVLVEVENEADAPAPVAYPLSNTVRIVDVLYPEKTTGSSGRREIHFYEKGYSDRAIIHLEDDDNTRLSLVIEPFLPRVETMPGHVDFSGILSGSARR